MKPINKNGRVGSNLTVTCSDWNLWGYEKDNMKYFCRSPCNDKDVIVKAEYGKTKRKNRIELTNSEQGLFVTFFNLQKSDSGKYYCGVGRYGPDGYIEVNVEVKDAETSSPLKTPNPVFVTDTTSPPTSTNGSTVFTDMSTNQSLLTAAPYASPTTGAGSVPYLIIGAIFIITLLMVLLKLLRKKTKKQKKAAARAQTPQEDVQEDDQYDAIRHEDGQSVSQPERFTAHDHAADPDSVYANCTVHQHTELTAQGDDNYSNTVFLNVATSSGVNSRGACSESRGTDQQSDSLYSVAQLPKKTQPAGKTKLNQLESNEDETLYSLAQRPRAT
ncbi:CMRF35-like molecule 5 [Notolabrus celidotus]|uniref:CMRF35-like molecule 5 n=1 Tax=Notolabrus celidotus TaxID=1203425 RepID=UPI00149063ED|nr:CMRF35-like molecule 5 [Notolabrus celidotus]